jgi:hypothetical protein
LGKGGRAAKQVAHAVAKEERNFIWKELNGIFRPVKTDAFKEAEEAAKHQHKKLPDPRAGTPTHGSHHRLTRPQQREVADDLGYQPYQARGGGQPKEPIFHNPDGDPPYISHDHTGHGSVDRTGQDPPNVAWKGASDPRTLENGGRDGTYVPKYRPDGSVYFDRVRN